MDRLEQIREYTDNILLNMDNTVERRCAYVHLYGVSQACAILALHRGECVELATIAGMLHDIYSYATMDTYDHAHKGAVMAKEIMDQLGIFSETEMSIVYHAIYNHSSKEELHTSFDEILKEADVLQHCLYNPSFEIAKHETTRFNKLKQELGLK